MNFLVLKSKQTILNASTLDFKMLKLFDLSQTIEQRSQLGISYSKCVELSPIINLAFNFILSFNKHWKQLKAVSTTL